MTPREFGLLLVSILAGSSGQLFLKLGALKLGRVSTGNFLTHILGIIKTPELLLGLTLYALSAIFYILLLTRVPLSVVGPAVALSYIISVLMGYFIFREAVPLSRIIGLGLIVFGVVLVVWRK